MIITLLKKRRGLLNEVQFDDGTYILIDRALCEENCLKENTEITEEKINFLEDETQKRRCKSRALYYLSCKDYSKKGLFAKLCEAGFSEPFVSETVNRMLELGLIDDNRFSERFVDCCVMNNMSNREIVAKAYLKHADINTVKELLETETFGAETVRIKNLLCTKYAQKEDYDKVIAALLRKGFSFGDIKTALFEIKEEQNEL